VEQRAGLKQGKKSPGAAAKGGRRDAAALGDGGGALDTTLQPGTSEGKRIDASEGKSQPSSTEKRDRSRFAAQPHPCPGGFHPTASSFGPDFARGSPRRVAAGDTRDARGRGFSGSGGGEIRSDSRYGFFFLDLCSATGYKTPGFWPKG